MPTSADEVRAIVAEMLADAETRSTLEDTAGIAGHDGAFYLRSPDGSMRLSVGGLVQFRYAYSHRTGDGESDEEGFFLPRTRLWFRGAVAHDITYFIRGQFSGTRQEGFAEERTIGGVFELDRAWIDVPLAEGWAVRFGQQVSDFSRENEHAPQDQLGVNASPTDSVFSLGGYQGLRIAYFGESIRAFFSSGNGARNVNRDFDDERNADFALTAKGDWLIAGNWSRFSDFTSRPGSDFAAMLGAGVHWENGARVGDPTENLALLGGIVELGLEGDGWNVFASFNAFQTTYRSPDNDELLDFGIVVQGGFYATERLEPFVRFDAVYPDADRDGQDEEFRTITAGINWYLFPGSSAAKFSLDAMYMLDDEAGALVNPSDNTGVLASDGDDQFTIRAQFTLVF
jgi:hypothetical protein